MKSVNRRVILSVVFSIIGIAAIAFLLTLGNNVTAPTPPTPGAAPSAPAAVFPKGASDANYTILCVKNGDGKIKYTKTGPYVTCPPDYATVPVQLDPKLIKK
jgi:hypothetical protein